MRELKLIGLDLKHSEHIDADDYGQRLVDCFKQIDSSVINIIKIKLGDSVSPDKIEKVVKGIRSDLKEMGATHCIFVPLIDGFIEDITIDHVEVRDV